jgi:uncharacterized protein
VIERRTSKRKPVKKIAAIVFLTFVVCILMGSGGISSWASRMNIGIVRSMILALITPLDNWTRSLSFDLPARSLRSAFLSVSGIEEDAGFDTTPIDQVTTDTSVQLQNSVTISDDPILERSKTIFSAENPLKVLFLGDSMIQGAIYISFTRSVFDDKSIVCTLKGRHSTGLSRPDYFNWPREAENICQNGAYDCVIVLMGTNDAQDIPLDGVTHRFNTPEWIEIYKARATQFISYLNGNVPRVYWIGLPRMRLPVYDASMQMLNSLYSDVCNRFTRVRFIPTAGPLADENGNYTDYITIDGRIEYLRSGDGIHFLTPAGKIISDMLLEAIKQDFIFEEKK